MLELMRQVEDLARRLAALETTPLAYTAGLYSPSLTNVTNIDASTTASAQYLRVGTIVTVSGYLTVDATAAGPTQSELGISLPIASAFTAVQHCGGVAVNGLSNNQTAAIDADATNDRARMRWLATDTADRTWAFIFQYRVL